VLFLLTSWLAEQLNLPFHVDGFGPPWGAIIVGAVGRSTSRFRTANAARDGSPARSGKAVAAAPMAP
jgi:hypothetical protein